MSRESRQYMLWTLGLLALLGLSVGFQSPVVVIPRAAVLSLGSFSRKVTWLSERTRQSNSVLFAVETKEDVRVSESTKEKPSRLRRLVSKLKSPFRRVRKLLNGEKEDSESEMAMEDMEDDEDEYATADIEVIDEVESRNRTVGTAPVTNRQRPRGSRKRARKISGDRWAVASTDLSGEWDILVNDTFKEEYDKYLMLLGQPMLVRSVAVTIVGFTTEETRQSEDGRSLFIRGRNVRGLWDRTIIASGADEKNVDFEPILTPITTADDEQVMAEAWWEREGTLHLSWMRGVKKYGGGDFESRRYLTEDDLLVCESTFHPSDETREKACVTWKFKRHGS